MHLAVIPARMGSRGLKFKNMALLMDKPLIHYTIEAALQCPFLDIIVVTSDMPELWSYVHTTFGKQIKIHRRNPKLAADDVPLAPVIIDVVNRYGAGVDTVFTLQPTSPLRDDRDITNAYKQFYTTDCDSLLSVTECRHSIWTPGGDPVLLPTVNRQDVSPFYIGNGAIFITPLPVLHEYYHRIGENPVLYVMSERNGIDIHAKQDLVLAEWYLQREVHK